MSLFILVKKFCMPSLFFKICFSELIFSWYFSIVIFWIQGASQLFMKYSKQGFLGKRLHILTLNIFLSVPMEMNLELPYTNGPKISPSGPVKSLFLFLLATNNL